MLELEAIGLDRVKTELSAQYVDHNVVQKDLLMSSQTPAKTASRSLMKTTSGT